MNIACLILLPLRQTNFLRDPAISTLYAIQRNVVGVSFNRRRCVPAGLFPVTIKVRVKEAVVRIVIVGTQTCCRTAVLRIRGTVLRTMGVRSLRVPLPREESMHRPYVAGYEADVGFEPDCLSVRIDGKWNGNTYVIHVPVRV